jgi:hypothetical protein
MRLESTNFKSAIGIILETKEGTKIMLQKLIATTLFALTSLGMSSQVSASLMLELETYSSGNPTPTSIGGYTMTDFSFVDGDKPVPVNSITSPLGDSVDFIDRDKESLYLDRRSADANSTWWVNGEESKDYNIYTTSLHLVTLILPENTRAFSFNVGANLSGSSNNAWLTATELGGSGLTKHWFNVNESNTPGFGLYTKNSNSCSSISSVTIDPYFIWGFGNFSINQDSCSTSVPEPSIIGLFGAGLFGIGFIRRRKLQA